MRKRERVSDVGGLNSTGEDKPNRSRSAPFGARVLSSRIRMLQRPRQGFPKCKRGAEVGRWSAEQRTRCRRWRRG